MIDQKKELRDCIEALFFAYREFTAKPDEILAERGLNRVHHRILYFVGKYPDIRVGRLLVILSVSKQALNMPLRQLIEMNLVSSVPLSTDRRVRCLRLTASGERLEHTLTQAQAKLLEKTFAPFPDEVRRNWIEVMNRLAQSK